MRSALLFLVVLLVTAATVLWIRHGGGETYPDLTGTPSLRADALEEVLAYPEPIGNVAVSSTGRIFFTVHPESRPHGNKLLEYVNGASVPYPSLAQQSILFDTPLGVAIDHLNRLWVIDHGNHGLRSARIIAIDLASGNILRDQRFDESIAPVGSLLQDLQISADGRTIVIADASFWRKSPALIIYDVETGEARRVLEGHPSLSAENYLIRTHGKAMQYLGGLVALRGGVDGIALGPEWLYYAALNGSGLYRIRLKDLVNTNLPASQLATNIERHSNKPLSDGLSIDTEGNVFVTDVEHSAIFKVDTDRSLTTLIQSPRMRWPDALSFGPDGYLYVADSALPELILKSNEHIRAQGPYQIFRFLTGSPGIPGQ
jgi:sugar lactone lactonase YvrE